MQRYTDKDLKDGLYVSVNPSLSGKFFKFYEFCSDILRSKGLPVYPPLELHATLVYSQDSPSVEACNHLVDPERHFDGVVTGTEMYEGHDNDGYLVLLIDSPSLQKRHKQWKEIGASHSFDAYKCHITLCSKFDIKSIEAKYCEQAINNYLSYAEIHVSFFDEKYEPLKTS
jgi:hypothetical protein